MPLYCTEFKLIDQEMSSIYILSPADVSGSFRMEQLHQSQALFTSHFRVSAPWSGERVRESECSILQRNVILSWLLHFIIIFFSPSLK